MNDPAFGADTGPDRGPSAALRDRMSSEHVDLIDLADRSVAAGTRLRRRRRLGATLVVGGGLAAAGVSAVVLVNALAGPQQAVDSPGFASAPPADAESPADSPEAVPPCSPVAHMPGDPTGDLQPVACEDGEPQAVVPQRLPVSLDLPGWTCGVAADDKTPCSGPDGGLVTLVVRPASDHDAWISDPDKRGSAVWVSPLHDNYFVSVQGHLRSTPRADFIDGLEFKPTWKRAAAE